MGPPLTRNLQCDQLKINMLVSRDGLMHVDTPDLLDRIQADFDACGIDVQGLWALQAAGRVLYDGGPDRSRAPLTWSEGQNETVSGTVLLRCLLVAAGHRDTAKGRNGS